MSMLDVLLGKKYTDKLKAELSNGQKSAPDYLLTNNQFVSGLGNTIGNSYVGWSTSGIPTITGNFTGFSILNPFNYSVGDAITGKIVLNIGSLSVSGISGFVELYFRLNRYDGNVQTITVRLRTDGTYSAFNSDGTVVATDANGNLVLYFTSMIVTSNAFSKYIRIETSSSSAVINTSIKILEFSVYKTSNKVSVKYAQQADAIPGLNTKTTKLDPIKNMDDWRRLGFGLFIHWGVYAALAGKFTGTDVTGAAVNYDALTGGAGAEWILRSARIPKSTYKANQSAFTGANWNPEDIARTAYNAGMKYIVLTAKHHEGFCLFQSSNAEWNISTSGAAGKELITPLKTACQKYGLKFGLYFSQNYDWTAVGGFGQSFSSPDNVTDPYTTQQHTDYVSKTVLLINEIMIKYAPDILWYDIPTAADSYMQPLKDNELSTYPNVVVNDRLSGTFIGDYATGEGAYYQGSRKYSENCYTLNGTWGYGISFDTAGKTKTTEFILKAYVLESIARGQNALINIGPKADGSVPALQKSILDDIGTFCKKYGSFFHSRSVNSQCQPQWGRMIAKGQTLICYVHQGVGTSIQVHGIHTGYIKSVRVFGASDEYAAGNYTIASETTLSINNLVYDATTGLAVVSIDFSNEIVSDDINYITEASTISCLAFNITGTAFVQKETGVPCIGGWNNDADYLQTVFLYTGVTGNYKVKHTYTSTGNSTTQKVTTQFTSLDDSVVQSVTIDKAVNPDNTSTGTVNLVNGKYYKLKVSKATGWINLSGIQFV